MVSFININHLLSTFFGEFKNLKHDGGVITDVEVLRLFLKANIEARNYNGLYFDELSLTSDRVKYFCILSSAFCWSIYFILHMCNSYVMTRKTSVFQSEFKVTEKQFNGKLFFLSPAFMFVFQLILNLTIYHVFKRIPV